MEFDVSTFDVTTFDRILAKGLSHGLGNRDDKVCIEAAICQTLGLPHGDDPGCVASSVRSFKIVLNDSSWSSSFARAKGLHDLGLAQLGSKGVVDDDAFSRRLQELTIRILLPDLFRLFDDAGMLRAADECEREGSTARAARAAGAAGAANKRPTDPDYYLNLSASLALQVLRELKSPGVALLQPQS